MRTGKCVMSPVSDRRVRFDFGRLYRMIIAFSALGVCTACEEYFEPFIAVDAIFSINGYLDAAADTQWIRVTPIRTSILTTPDPVDAVVTLEHLGTGRIVEFMQKVEPFDSGNFQIGLAYAHNFWTTEPIERGATYRLAARRPDGAQATAIVKIPRGLDSENRVVVGIPSTSSTTAYVRFSIPDGEQLAILGVEHHRRPIPQFCAKLGYPPDLTLYPFQGDRPTGPLEYQSGLLTRALLITDPPECANGQPPLTYARWRIRISLSGEPWPFKLGDPIGYLGQGSNVANGFGFVGGVESSTVPFELCGFIGAGAPSVCELIYEPETATLDVTPYIYPGPTDLAFVRLRKGDEGWVRTGYNYPPEAEPPSPVHRFPGLEPGSYRVEVRHRFINEYYCEERNLVLAPGEYRAVQVDMETRAIRPDEPVNERGCREG